MNYKYNILWLDDEPIKALEQIREINPSIYFDKVDYVDICEMILESQPEKYHAVILDANGVSSDSPEKDANKSGFLRLVHSVIDNHLPLYIYSGQLLRAADGDSADIVLEELYRLGLKDNIFYKSGAPYDLIDKVVKDLDNKYQYYEGYKHFLSFFSNGWIPNKYKTQYLDPIMEYYYRKDYNSAHGNQMRNITEQILHRVNIEFQLDTTSKEGDKNRFANIAKAIKAKKLDFSSSISGPLLHMIDVTNAQSHNAMSEDELKLYFESDFSTFFIVANWFYKIMTQLENAQHVEESSPDSSEDLDNSNKPSESPEKKQKPKTHENTRSGVLVATYKENGRTYCDLKVEIPWKWKDYSQLLITTIIPSNDPKKGVWYPYCQEVNSNDL
ncbi:MAG: hypothetical protein IKR89_02385 [Bacteroidaceae bacterium]|nr:hypothetical protein [Bacteroidaceae bacterium]